jgi:adenylyltransferase/sulfurtransferase
MLTSAELARYGRQLVLPEVGLDGQERLREARVLVVGAGGLGSPVALYLAAAGVGTIGILDDDELDESNLHRQVIHRTSDVGRSKAESAADAIRALNANVTVVTIRERLDASGASRLFGGYDLIVDGSDNYATRYAINDACAEQGRAWIYGSVERFSGQVSVFGAPGGPCYRCIFPEAPAPGSTASCEEIGVLGAVPGVIGSLQATEALKWIIGIGDPLVGRLLQMDLLRGQVRTIAFARRPDCPACGRQQSGKLNVTTPDLPFDILPEDLAGRLRNGDAPALLDVREQWEWDLARLPDAQRIAMGDLEERVGSLDPDRELVVYCHHGARSRMAVSWLRTRGFRARNLAGGIARWSREVDPSVPQY